MSEYIIYIVYNSLSEHVKNVGRGRPGHNVSSGELESVLTTFHRSWIKRQTSNKVQKNVALLKLFSDVATVCGCAANLTEIRPIVVKSFPSGSSAVGRVRPLGIMNLNLTIKIFQLGEKH